MTLVEAYREHNEPLHEELEAFWEVVEVLPAPAGRRPAAGLVTAKRPRERAAGIRLASRASRRTSRWSSAPRTRSVTSLTPPPFSRRWRGSRPRRSDAAYVGDSPFDVRAAKAAGVYAVAVAWGGIHGTEALEREEPDVLVHHAEELLGVL